MSVMESLLAEVKAARPIRSHEADRAAASHLAVPVSTKDLCPVTRQLATLLRAGMPLVPALSAIVEQLQSAGAKKTTWPRNGELSLADLVREIRDKVNAGASLSSALADYPEVFGPLFTHIVVAR